LSETASAERRGRGTRPLRLVPQGVTKCRWRRAIHHAA